MAAFLCAGRFDSYLTVAAGPRIASGGLLFMKKLNFLPISTLPVLSKGRSRPGRERQPHWG